MRYAIRQSRASLDELRRPPEGAQRMQHLALGPVELPQGQVLSCSALTGCCVQIGQALSRLTIRRLSPHSTFGPLDLLLRPKHKL